MKIFSEIHSMLTLEPKIMDDPMPLDLSFKEFEIQKV